MTQMYSKAYFDVYKICLGSYIFSYLYTTYMMMEKKNKSKFILLGAGLRRTGKIYSANQWCNFLCAN